jgi:DNA-binding NarL/FixJ family response regulator
LSEDTVKKHVSSILAKLAVPDRAAAATVYAKYLASKQRAAEKGES